MSILSKEEQNTPENIKTSFHCGAKCNTWANQRRRRREDARRLTGMPSSNQTENSLNDSELLRRANEKSEDIKTTGNIPRIVVQSFGITTKDLDRNSDVVPVKCPGDKCPGDKCPGDKCPGDKCPGDSERSVQPKGCDKFLELSCSSLNDGYFIEFHLEVGVKLAEVIPGIFPNVFLRMQWVDGKDRNSMYQLFQYFQNHLIHSI